MYKVYMGENIQILHKYIYGNEFWLIIFTSSQEISGQRCIFRNIESSLISINYVLRYITILKAGYGE